MKPHSAQTTHFGLVRRFISCFTAYGAGENVLVRLCADILDGIRALPADEEWTRAAGSGPHASAVPRTLPIIEQLMTMAGIQTSSICDTRYHLKL